MIEHLYWAHHGTGIVRGGRSRGGTEVLSYENVPGSHDIRFTREGRITIESVFMFPGICVLSFPNSVPLFMAVPVSRTESRLFVTGVSNPPKKLRSLIFKLIPRLYLHLRNHNVLDGDIVFLRVVQRELPDPSEWKNKFLPLPATCDKYVVLIRHWMDKYRDDMPWASEAWPLPDVPRSALLDRYNSHVIHCKSCLGAFKGFERAIAVAGLLANICLMVLVSCTIIAVTGSIDPSQLRKVNVSIIFTLSLLITSVSLRILIYHMKQQFILTDNARKLLLTA